MKKIITAALGLILSTGAFAITDSALAKKCETKGLEKLQEHADSLGCGDVGDLQVNEVDNRVLNPYKYIWYTGVAECNGGEATEIVSLVQYDSFSKKCL